MFKNRVLAIIFFTIFVDLLGYGILIPVIPQLFANPESTFYLLPIGVSVKTGYILLGLLLAVFPIGQFFATPILGQLSDKYGRKKLLALSLLGTSISYLIFAIGIVTKNIPLLFVSRFFDGITGGNVAIAQAMIADISTKENRVRNFGMIGAAFGLGFIFGPYLGGRLSDPATVSWFTAATPFYFATILAFLNMLSVLFVVPETNKNPNKSEITWTKSVRNIVEAIEMKGVNIIFLTNFLFFAGFTFFTTFFAVYLIDKFKFTQGNIGDFFAYIGIWSAFSQLFITHYVALRFKEVTVIRLTLIGSGILILAFFLPKYAWQILLIPPFFSMCNGLSMANITSLLSHSTPQNVQGEILGINASVQALAQSIPAILSGFIAADITPETPLVVASIVIILSGIVFQFLFKERVEYSQT